MTHRQAAIGQQPVSHVIMRCAPATASSRDLMPCCYWSATGSHVMRKNLIKNADALD
jgi:hypothetical protein